jgi:hypothetical protein
VDSPHLVYANSTYPLNHTLSAIFSIQTSFWPF